MTAPEVPHADLIAQLREPRYGREPGSHDARLLVEAADALAALGDTVPRNDADEAMTEAWYRAARERDEARAERDLIAREVKDTPHASWCIWQEETRRHIGHPCDCYLADAIKAATAPAVSLALHDAEVKAQALDELADEFLPGCAVDQQLRRRAAAIREQAGK